MASVRSTATRKTPPRAAAGRNDNGNGWNPPIQEQWYILRMEKPAWWGTGRGPSETA